MNSFFASVEAAKDPSLKNVPMAVCGSVEARHGIILAKNQLAKKFDIKTGEPIVKAKAKCPELVTVEANYDDYIKYSEAARQIYDMYTDLIEPFGIDECWLDVSGSTLLFGDGEKIANELRERIKKELGVTISVGVSFNKTFAKLGSDMKKPDAVTLIPQGSFKEKIWHLPASELLGIGPSTYKTLNTCGIFTIGQLAMAHPPMLRHKLGINGLKLISSANGLDTSPVKRGDEITEAKSVSRGSTLFRDLFNDDDVWSVILTLSEEIGHTLISYKKLSCTVSVYVRDSQLNHRQFSKKLDMPTDSYSIIAREAFKLFKEKYRFERPIRSVTVCTSDFIPFSAPRQMSFFSSGASGAKKELIDRTMDSINRRFGKEKIRYGVLISNELAGIPQTVGFKRGDGTY